VDWSEDVAPGVPTTTLDAHTDSAVEPTIEDMLGSTADQATLADGTQLLARSRPRHAGSSSTPRRSTR
jgi:hypothetical protein